MRVIAGSLGGRQFQSPKGYRTHPMSDRMRGGLFNVLGDITGLSVLDAFAGSGALAIEALSRGAGQALTVDADKNAHEIIMANARSLGISDRLKATKAYLGSWSARNEARTFDLIMADPPYDDIPYRDLNKLPSHLKPGGTLVLSWPGQQTAPELAGLKVVQNKNYGDAQLVFYQKIS